MNNPEFQKAALHLSTNVYKMDIDINDKITKLYRTITGRAPNKNELSKLVIFYTHASPKDGGYGAYYVRLRKNFK